MCLLERGDWGGGGGVFFFFFFFFFLGGGGGGGGGGVVVDEWIYHTLAIHKRCKTLASTHLTYIIEASKQAGASKTYPKLHIIRHNPQPAPERRHGDLLLILEPLLHLPDPPLQHIPTLNPNALPTRPGPKPAPANPCVEVNLTLLLRQPLRDPLDAHLPFHLAPVEGQRGAGVAGHVRRLAGRAPVGVDDEATGVELLEVDCARAHTARG